GAKIISSATFVDEARWLEDQGCDAIIAQGYEAGGHRGTLFSAEVSTQVGTMALVPQVVDAVKVPVIAARGIADARYCGGFRAWRRGSADRHSILALPGGPNQSYLPSGIERGEGQWHCRDQCIHRASSARDRDSSHARDRTNVRCRPGVSARCCRASTAPSEIRDGRIR